MDEPASIPFSAILGSARGLAVLCATAAPMRSGMMFGADELAEEPLVLCALILIRAARIADSFGEGLSTEGAAAAEGRGAPHRSEARYCGLAFASTCGVYGICAAGFAALAGRDVERDDWLARVRTGMRS